MSDLLNESQVAEKLGCTVSALRRWRREARGPRYFKISRMVRYSRDDIDAYIARCAVGQQHKENDEQNGTETNNQASCLFSPSSPGLTTLRKEK